MPRYSSDSIYPEDAPYQPSRSALRRRFGNRAIVSKPTADSGRPGSPSVRNSMGFTDEATWRSFFTPTAQPAAPMQPAPATFYNEQNPFGTMTPGRVTSGTNFVSRFGTGSVRSAADVVAGRNAPQNLSAWDAFLKSPAPAAPPAASLDLLPSPRQGTIPSRASDFSPTPTADGPFNPTKLNLTTGILNRLAKPSPWEEPI